MPSVAYREWAVSRARILDDVEAAHAAIGGTGRGRRLATQQVNRAYALLLVAEFQGFCRDLHTECAEHIVSLVPATVQEVVRNQFLFSRALDRGNPNPANLGSDFGRFGLKFWDKLDLADPRVADWRRALDALNEWRNAIAHSDFNPTRLGGTILQVRQVRGLRAVCRRLAWTFDTVLAEHLGTMTGLRPW